MPNAKPARLMPPEKLCDICLTTVATIKGGDATASTKGASINNIHIIIAIFYPLSPCPLLNLIFSMRFMQPPLLRPPFHDPLPLRCRHHIWRLPKKKVGICDRILYSVISERATQYFAMHLASELRAGCAVSARESRAYSYDATGI